MSPRIRNEKSACVWRFRPFTRAIGVDRAGSIAGAFNGYGEVVAGRDRNQKPECLGDTCFKAAIRDVRFNRSYAGSPVGRSLHAGQRSL